PGRPRRDAGPGQRRLQEVLRRVRLDRAAGGDLPPAGDLVRGRQHGAIDRDAAVISGTRSAPDAAAEGDSVAGEVRGSATPPSPAGSLPAGPRCETAPPASWSSGSGGLSSSGATTASPRG